jgi:hypothetical protein
VPSVSKKQHNLMAMVANNPVKAKELGIPQKVGQEFTQADKGMKFGKAPTNGRADLQKINSPKTLHGKSQLFKEGGHVMAKNQGITTAKMGKVKTAAPSRDGVASKGKTKGTQIKMKAAGKPLGMCGGGKTGKK